jgi:hypothetical protein
VREGGREMRAVRKRRGTLVVSGVMAIVVCLFAKKLGTILIQIPRKVHNSPE